jgi:hypothetical protein
MGDPAAMAAITAAELLPKNLRRLQSFLIRVILKYVCFF